MTTPNRLLLTLRTRMAHTMIELVLAMSSATVLLAGLGTTVLITSRALEPAVPEQSATSAADAGQRLLRDVRMATGFTERTQRAVTFNVPDRDGDGRHERLRYSWSGKSGDPLMLTYNAQTSVAVSGGLSNVELDYITNSIAGVTLPAEQSGSEILFLIKSSRSPTAEEQAKRTLLESWNFVVNPKGQDDDVSVITSAAQRASVIYIASSFETSNTSLLTTLSRSDRGIVSESDRYVDDLGFASDSDKSLAFSIKKEYSAGSHYITQETPFGNTNITVLPVLMLRLKGTISPDVAVLGTISNNAGLVTFNRGDISYNGTNVPGRRVLLPWAGDLTTQLMLNNNGLGLMRRSVEWASGMGADAADVNFFGYQQVFASNVAVANQQLATRVSLPEHGKLLTISAYVGGAIRATRFAIYSDTGSGPGNLIAQSNTANTSLSMGWLTLELPATTLSPGNYWLTVAFSGSGQALRQNASEPAGMNATKPYGAVNSGFLPTWGTGTNAAGARSIYGLYEVLP